MPFITAILVCTSWCLPAPAQEIAPPAEGTAASSAPVAAAVPALDMTEAANWGYRNRSSWTQEMAFPAEGTTANSPARFAAPAAAIDVTEAATWAYRNRSALSIGATLTARMDDPNQQAAPFPRDAPARPSARTPTKPKKHWTVARIAAVAGGIALTGTGAVLTATGSMTTKDCGSTPRCASIPVWDGNKKAGVWLMGFGIPLTLAGFLAR